MSKLEENYFFKFISSLEGLYSLNAPLAKQLFRSGIFFIVAFIYIFVEMILVSDVSYSSWTEKLFLGIHFRLAALLCILIKLKKQEKKGFSPNRLLSFI